MPGPTCKLSCITWCNVWHVRSLNWLHYLWARSRNLGHGPWSMAIHWPAMTTHNKRVDICVCMGVCVCLCGVLFNQNVKRANLASVRIWLRAKTIVSLGCIKYLRTQFSITKCFSSFCLLANWLKDGHVCRICCRIRWRTVRPVHWLSSQWSSLSYVRAMQKPLIKCHTDGP